MPQQVTYADVDAGVRRAIAAYTQAVDDGRTDDILATFCPDAEVDIASFGTHRGLDALRTAYEKVVPRLPQRHLVLNTLVTAWDQERASTTSDVVFLLLLDGKWRVQLVGRYDDELRREADGEWRFTSRSATFLP